MAALRGRSRALSNDRNLRRYVLQATPTGVSLGTGSYGSVEEVKVNGLVCAAKKIHEFLIDTETMGVRQIAAKYMQECQILSDLRHPNITQFMGVCFLANSQLPLLVMERLEGSLDDLLETVPHIPLALKLSILEDVAKGLLYLHKHDPQIIHMDLTAKNVLLTPSLVGKITDSWNSHIVDIKPDQLAETLSQSPGTLVYMPPEALTAASRYGPSLDVFSFGHLALFVGLQVFPSDLLEPTYTYRRKLLPRSEVKRRGQYIEQLNSEFPNNGQHQFVQLVTRCLQNEPHERPTTEELITSLEEMKAEIEGPYGDIAKADAVRQVVTMRALRRREIEVREKRDESSAKDVEIHKLQKKLEHEQAERTRVEEQLQQKKKELNSVQQKFQRICADLDDREAQLRAKEIEMKQREVEINRLMEELRRCQAQLLRHQEGGSAVEECSQWSEGQEIEQTPLNELEIPLKLTWRRGGDMPNGIRDHVQAIMIGRNIYVGGEIRLNVATVMVYSLETGMWTTLPPYENKWFGMAAVNNNIVLVGGQSSSSGRVSNLLRVWDEESQMWTHPYPEMPTARHSPSVISYHKWLVVVGGYYEVSACRKAEILDTHSGQWYDCSPLPSGCSIMSSAISGNMWYLLDRFSSLETNKQAFSVCLDEFVSQAVAHTTGTTSPSTPSPWKSLPEPPLNRTTALIFNGALLSVGGWCRSDIHLYQPSSRRWVKVGDLPEMRSDSGCIVLPSGEIFVAGGTSGSFYAKSVCISSIV